MGLAAASPKIVGAATAGVGKLQKLGKKFNLPFKPGITNAITKTEEADPAEPFPDYKFFKGGRVGRKAGGNVTFRPDPAATRRANELINLAERLKKDEGRKTSSILKIDDNTIAKALAIASQHI